MPLTTRAAVAALAAVCAVVLNGCSESSLQTAGTGAAAEAQAPVGSADAESRIESTPREQVPKQAAPATDASRARRIESTPREKVPSALLDPSNPAHPAPLVDLDEIRRVVSPDAIPSLEDPDFEPAAAVDWLPPVEPVVVLEIDGDARAYPLRLMTWHELVNGSVGATPVTVSYCPLCNSAVAYDRRVGDRVLDFGTSGALLNSSLVMYDRQTESLWSHYTGQAVAGHLTGAQLDLIPVQTVSFESFLDAYPGGLVLSADTGHRRDYGRNPYEGYDDPDETPFLFDGPFDDRLAPMMRVVAVRDGETTAVIPLDLLAERRVVEFSLGAQDLVALYVGDTVSALDTPTIADGRDVGATGVFEAVLDGDAIELVAGADGLFADSRTSAVFDVLGRRSDGDGPPLVAVEHLDTFWFSAAAFYPDALVVSGSKR